MQTLRKRTSPCKYKNDPSRFLGEGITFKAKLIGILEVSEARGDKMCQDALNDLKTAIRAAGEHKQRITISISIDGLRLRDEKTGDCLYHHPVHKISFIAQDMSDSRAFGYIFGSPDTGHRFFGIKTDKTASQVVISMRDLFQVVFELKKKEIEMAKHHSEQHQLKYTSSGYMDSIHFSKDDGDADKTKGKYSQLLKSRCLTSKPGDASTSEYKGPTSEAIADLLDLEHELNSIQQGITQMEKITPPDPFGPLSKADPYIDPFDDSFSPKGDKPPEDNVKTHPCSSHHTDDPSDHDPHSSLFAAPPSSAKPVFFPQFSPGTTKPKADDAKWFDQETESLFNDSANASNAELTGSPVTLNSALAETEQLQPEGKKSPVKTDLFTELDPLGTGRVKPYVDKKDFFQELKNPPKKLLKELITETTNSESPSFYFPANFKEEKTPKTPPTAKSDSAHSSGTNDSTQGFTPTPRYSKIDPFEDSDPFDKTDPFHEETFPSLFPSKPSIDNIFDDKPSWKLDVKEDTARSDFPLFSSATLRVSLPPENIDPAPPNFKSPPDSPENPKTLRRKNYHALKQITVDGSEDSPVHEEPFVTSKVTNYLHKSEGGRRTPNKDKYYSLQSPPSSRNEKSKVYASLETSDVTTPDPPPRAKTSLFYIKPPPLPPKKATHSNVKPPARPPSLEDHYDYLDKREQPPSKEELKCVKLKKHILTTKNSPPGGEIKKHSSDSAFPILPPPPHRKPDSNKINSARKSDKPSTTPGSILNLKLNQLDNTGLENLAITLGIPSENIYSMTLQELTKMLAEKYLIAEAKADHPSGDSFEVDFDANFAKMDASDPKSATTSSTSYDKYAVFKELMANETKPTAVQSSSVAVVATAAEVSASGQEEDRYAALRQLSLNVDKCENASEDEEGESKAGGTSPAPEDFSCTLNKVDMAGGLASSKWSEGKVDIGEIPGDTGAADREGSSGLFPLVDEFSGEKPSGKDNWATFEKSDFGDRPTKKAAGAFENENSPVSSDGKEDVRDMEFWQETGFRKRTRKDVPWQDDDESWDDYSPKESFCSDESSHEERSPDPRKSDRYEKSGWEACSRVERKWNGKNSQWGQREKWNEETEDEFEESWRKQKERTSSYEFDRKTGFWHNMYGKHHDWCNSRSEPWDENDRHMHCYVNMRKRSESDNEYRKRCDSDASEKECVWTFQKSYADSLARSGKQKQYHGAGHAFRDCPEHCHESRAKHRKGVPQKRPSSASESKRSYEKMCSPGEYPCRGPDKPYPPKPEKDDYFRYQCPRKDFRHRGDTDFSHYHSDKRAPQHSRASSRTSRGTNSVQTDLYSSPNKRNDHIDTQNHHFDYFEPFRENKHRNFHFDGEAVNSGKGRKGDQFTHEFSKGAETRANHWASANGKTHGDGFYSGRGGESFAKFPEESKVSPKKTKNDGKTETGPEAGRAEGKGKGHLGAPHRQESSATLRKSDSINIFSRDKDPFEGDDFFSSVS